MTLFQPNFPSRANAYGLDLSCIKIWGWLKGTWRDECDISDITQFLKILVLNRPSLEAKSTNFASQVFEALEYAINTRFVNSLANTLSNISAHYDLGNDMFTQILDPTLTYSCPIWEECEVIGSSSSTRCSTPNTIQLNDEFLALERAQLRKIHTIIKKAKLVESDHLLEIGSGWGSLSIEAVRQSGCRVTTLTLSTEQKALAETKICEAGFSDRISVVLMDYRKVHELGILFDKIISIEMLEAVGKEYIQTYFETCSNVLKRDGGIMVFQCITIHEPLYYNYCRQVEFIQKYIFPGGHLPTITVLANAINQGSKGSLIINEVTNIGAHYIRALRLWREKFDANFSSIEKHDPERYTPQFKRTWDYYFSYCEAGFAMHCLGDVIAVLTRQNNLSIADGVPV
ncbi:hypothetical protein DSO57_1034225 [Entomophthora muscae]|uniref:Uncharacterized protein n=1 Tax=Entomophthora muscae TaxID=34485 RepID=A0ACC2SNZ5_9FUNG|nr:hypothetical protein DSO57_1034225 [Entomophthora muscae]